MRRTSRHEPRAAESLNSLGDALRGAGYETKPDKLRRLMAQAIGKPGDPGAGLSAPSIARFEALLLNEEDAELVWELFAAVRADVARKLFEEVLPEVRAGKDFGGQQMAETQVTCAPEGDAAAETNLLLKPEGTMSQPAAVAPITATPPAIREHHKPPGDGINGMQMIMRWNSESWLKRFTVGNRLVHSMRRSELDQAIRTTHRNSRFLELIRDSWPPHADNETVGFWLSDEDGDKLYEMAKEEAHAA